MNIKRNVASGFKWSALERLSVQLIQVLIQLVLARLLGPDAFSLVGMLAIFIAIAQVFIEGGVTNALLRKEIINEQDLSTAFVINFSMSLIIYLIIYLTAPLISAFYSQPDLANLIKILSLVIIFNSLSIVQKINLSRTLNFKIQAISSFSSILISSVISLTLAFNGFGVWSLVFQQVCYSLLNTILLNTLSSWIPKKLPSKHSFIYLISFGYKLVLTNLLDAIFNNIYPVLIGKFYPLHQVGFYTQASNLSFTPAQSISTIITRVLYPILSKTKKKSEFNRSYLISLGITSYISSLIILSIGISSFFIADIFLGDSWQGIADLIFILCVAYLPNPVYSINVHVLQIKGYPGAYLKLELLRKIIILITLIIMLPLGIKAICLGIAIQSYIMLTVNIIYTSRIIKISLKKQFVRIFYPIVYCSFAGLFSWIITLFLPSSILKLIAFLLIFLTSSVYLLKRMQPHYFSYIKNIKQK
ncbi:lipopolysaccharide biosynthesis protein [Providencia stuartii]|uniref:lipopolysaccharide biosynthesis protein n=1 Tax=Providencia stuartii TaxID=588 RepID=UPI0013D091A7|nr:lipopolysaccharide biosynthesis protein [Providencia stuartii]